MRPKLRLRSISSIENIDIYYLQKLLLSHGPLTVGLDGGTTGIETASREGSVQCTTNNINHVVLLYGYNQTHWFVKNSWGTNWGHEGYAYISKDNDCGITKFISVLELKRSD